MRIAMIAIAAAGACAPDHGSWDKARNRLCDNIGLVHVNLVDRLALTRLGHVPQLVDAELAELDPGMRRVQLVQRSLQACRELVAQWQWVDGALFGFKTAALAVDLGRREGQVEIAAALPMAIDAPVACEITCSATDCDDWPKAFNDRIVEPLRAVAAKLDGHFAGAIAKCEATGWTAK